VYDTFKEKYSSLFEITNIYFSGFCSQGDGAMFEYGGDKLIDVLQLVKSITKVS
jgi:hypothetical protein